MNLLQESLGHNLVQFGENVREQVAFICNCCGCCCEALLAAKRFALLSPIATTNFLPEVDRRTATAAGSAWRPARWRPWALSQPEIPASLNASGRSSSRTSVWAAACASASVPGTACRCTLVRNASSPPSRPPIARYSWPSNGASSRTSSSTTRPTGTTGPWPPSWAAILKLPPVKQIMASRQIKSIYLDRLLVHRAPIGNELRQCHDRLICSPTPGPRGALWAARPLHRPRHASPARPSGMNFTSLGYNPKAWRIFSRKVATLTRGSPPPNASNGT